MPFFSVVIPVFDGGAPFWRCLNALNASTFEDWELIVVDDGSTDGSAAVAAAHGARVVHTSRRGPAHARNVGAQLADGIYLFFIDADCAVHPHTLQRAAAHLAADPELDALFGSYDAEPEATNTVSQYKNLQHHYVHQTSSPHATTFWTGCGAVRGERFRSLGGFDAGRFPRPSIEDIEFGYRLTADGGRILLAKDVQVTHLKQWTVRTWLSADIRHRAIPWARLMRERATLDRNLNLQWSQRMSGACATLLLPAALWPRSRKLAPFLAAILLGLNNGFYRFLWRKRGTRFLLAAIPLHWLFFIYSTLTFATVMVLDPTTRAASASTR